MFRCVTKQLLHGNDLFAPVMLNIETPTRLPRSEIIQLERWKSFRGSVCERDMGVCVGSRMDGLAVSKWPALISSALHPDSLISPFIHLYKREMTGRWRGRGKDTEEMNMHRGEWTISSARVSIKELIREEGKIWEQERRRQKKWTKRLLDSNLNLG